MDFDDRVLPAASGVVETDPADDPGVDRRDLLKGAGTVAAWLEAANPAAAQPSASDQLALKGIKPTDAIIIGMYRRFRDQIGQKAQFVREILA